MEVPVSELRELLGHALRAVDSCETQDSFVCGQSEDITQRFFDDCSQPNRVHPLKHPVFASLSHAFSHIVFMVRNIIQNASVYEEEDFNSHLPFSCISMFSQSEVIDLLYKTEMDLSIEAALEVSYLYYIYLYSFFCPSTSVFFQKNAEKRDVILSIVARLEFIRLFIVTISLLVPPQNKEPELELNEVASLNANGFRPNIENAVTSATRMIALSSKFLETMHLGISWPENVTKDGDFGWLTAFEPELNRRYMPSTFPRLTEIFRREIALPHLHRMSCKIHFIASQTENHIEDVSTLIEFMKWFNYDESCTLTRSILQLVLFPLDDNILGVHPTAGLVENALRNSVLPFVFIPNTAASKDDACRKVVEDFTMNTTRVMLSLFQNFVIATIILLMQILHSPHLLFLKHLILLPIIWSLVSVLNYLLRMNIHTCIESDMHSKKKKNKKKIKNRPSIEEHIRMRVAIGHDQMILRCGHCRLSEAIVRISVALRKLGKINVRL
uniref:Protein MAK10 homolog n=1 Tax=Heterorhabditis bacteriophora TaxID=37862 RepID=A0A1I7XMS4_HETBA